MSSTLLIDAIVRQTTVLIAGLATAAGQRAPLAHVADQVFADLVRELNEQGLGQKVIADMFGMALRTYHARVARLAESATDQGRSLWEAVLTHVREAGPVLRNEVLAEFGRDNDLVVRSVLRDLVDSGLIYRAGRGDATSYRPAEPAELSASDASVDLDSLLLVCVHQNGPISVNRIAEIVPADEHATLQALERLCDQRLVSKRTQEGENVYDCHRCVIPFGDRAGWEASVFDHFQAMVAALVTKLRVGTRRADLSDSIGGSTFTFDIWPGHPMADEILGFLKSVRERGLALRRDLEASYEQHGKPPGAPWMRVVTYVGQSVKSEDEQDDENNKVP